MGRIKSRVSWILLFVMIMLQITPIYASQETGENEEQSENKQIGNTTSDNVFQTSSAAQCYYTIEYYEEELDGSYVLSEGTENYAKVYGSKGDTIILDSDYLDLMQPRRGFCTGEVQTAISDAKIKEDNTSKVIVYYKREKYEYKIKYYKDANLQSNFIGESKTYLQKFGTQLTKNMVIADTGDSEWERAKIPAKGYKGIISSEFPIEIMDGDNTVTIIYKKTKNKFNIDHIYEGEIRKIRDDSNLEWGEYFEKTKKDKTGFTFNRIEVKSDPSNSVINGITGDEIKGIMPSNDVYLKFYYNRNKYKMNVTHEYEDIGSATTDKILDFEAEVDEHIEPKLGYHLEQIIGADNLNSDISMGTVKGTMPAKDLNIIFKYSKNKNMLSVTNRCEGQPDVTTDKLVRYGDLVSEVGVPKPGYTLVKDETIRMNDTDNDIDKVAGVMPDNPVEIIFYYVKNIHNMKVINKYEGQPDITTDKLVKYDESVSETGTPKIGYTLVKDEIKGMNDTDSDKNKVAGKMPDNAVEIIFYYEKNIHNMNVIHRYEGQPDVTTNKLVKYAEPIFESCIPKDGFVYLYAESIGMKNTAVDKTKIAGTMPDNDITIIFHYEEYIPGGGGGGGGTSTPATYNVTVKYVDKETNEEIKSPYVFEKEEGEIIKSSNLDKIIQGYIFSNADPEELEVSSDEKANVIIFYFNKENLDDGPKLNKIDHFAYIIGYPDKTIKPQNTITREEVAMIFYRLLDDDSRSKYLSETNTYSDVDNSRWSNTAISTLSNAGVLSGYEDETFRPGEAIKRGEFAAIAAKFDKLEFSEEELFTDIKTHWAEQYIISAAMKEWIAGYDDKTFKPEQNITRAETMSLINNVLERKVDKKGIHKDAIRWIDNGSDMWYYEIVIEATNSHDYTRGKDNIEVWTKIKPNKVWK